MRREDGRRVLSGSKRVLLASAWFIYSGGTIVLNPGEPPNTLWGLAQLASAVTGIAGTVWRQPRLVLVAAGVAVVSLLVFLAPSAARFLTGARISAGEGPLFFGLLFVFMVPPLVMLWGAFAMSRTQRRDSTPRD